MKTYKNRLISIILGIEATTLVFCVVISCLEMNQRINNKASLFTDSIRSDFVLNDQKSLLQKIEVATISHEFEDIQVSNNEEVILEPQGLMSIQDRIPILSIPNEIDSAPIGWVIFSYSLATGVLRGLTLWGLFTFIFLFFVPFLKRNIEESLLKDAEVKRIRELNMIATAVAHDIRSPLSTLNSLVSNISLVEPEAREIIIQVSKRINSIADDLLDQAKDRAKYDISPTNSIKLKSIIERIHEEKSREYIQNSSLKILLRVENLDPTSEVSISEGELSRIISNLINNSVESIIQGGTILLQAYSKEKFVLIDIQDDGAGIAEDVLNKLLANQRVSTKRNGNGIGLLSSSTALRKNGGSLHIYSKLGVGTKITIQLPTS